MRKRSKTKTLHKKAWDIFSLWVRNRDKRCVTCGSRVTLQAGHYWHGVLDFDEININAQCSGCNHFRSGNLALYASYLINKYGIDEFKALEMRHWMALKGEKRTAEEYEEIIHRYTLADENTV